MSSTEGDMHMPKTEGPDFFAAIVHTFVHNLVYLSETMNECHKSIYDDCFFKYFFYITQQKRIF